jgi:hypothetical protein
MKADVRKICKVGTAEAVFLPVEWVRKNRIREVLMIYDDIILILPKHYEKKVDDEFHELIKRLVGKGVSEAEAQSVRGVEPQPEHEEVLAHE